MFFPVIVKINNNYNSEVCTLYWSPLVVRQFHHASNLPRCLSVVNFYISRRCVLLLFKQIQLMDSSTSGF